MNENENENVSQEETTEVPEQSVEQKETVEIVQPVVTPKDSDSVNASPKSEDINLSPELTQETLDIATKNAIKDGKVWEEITQEERWQYIKDAK